MNPFATPSAGSLLFGALAIRAGNFDKLLAQIVLKPAHYET